ncbi:MAG: sugar-binding protein [bacterium]|nr:sugar-binding protein [bacterium]
MSLAIATRITMTLAAVKRFTGLILMLSTLVLGVAVSNAQTGMEFSEFKRKIEPYFADELIADLVAAMPQGAQYRIWGWDVGDFSGDGVYDVAFSVNILGTRRKESTVYLFIDTEGFLVNIGRYPLSYIDLPLEVGVAVKEGACYITQKRRAENWSIRGYQYRDGSVVLLDEFETDQIGVFAHEAYRNYRTLETRERFVNDKGVVQFKSDYLTIPCYGRGRQVHAGFVSDVTVSSVRSAQAGAYWWQGPEDASFDARVVYDNDFLYVRMTVRDSTVITGWCDTCPADRIELWWDVTPPEGESGSRAITSIERNKLRVRTSTDSGLFNFSVRIGDFAERRPVIKVRTTDDLEGAQDQAVQQVRVVTSQVSDGYVVKVRIPFLLLGYDRAPVDERILTELGLTIGLYDVDNEFREEETTILATSPIRPLDPSSYGAVRFVPDDLWYGETVSIYSDAVLSQLRELGF